MQTSRFFGGVAAVLCMLSAGDAFAGKYYVQINSLYCQDTADTDGQDELDMFAEVTGDNTADLIWQGNMSPGNTAYFGVSGWPQLGPYECEVTTPNYACKAFTVRDRSTSWFDVAEDIGTLVAYNYTGTREQWLELNGSRYLIRYTVTYVCDAGEC